jgi:mannose-6-phosphate isomerase-like protein (cupin superfamily)
MHTIHEKDAKVYHLPGRDWYYLLGPLTCPAEKLVFGLAEFPADSQAGAHMHENEEEIIYILSGRGQIVFADGADDLEPGVATFIPPGVEHRIAVVGDEPLRMVTLFSPPVTPGAYDRDQE